MGCGTYRYQLLVSATHSSQLYSSTRTVHYVDNYCKDTSLFLISITSVFIVNVRTVFGIRIRRIHKFCASRIRIRNCLCVSGSSSGSFYRQAKNLENLGLWLLNNLLSLKTDLNLTTVNDKQKKLRIYFFGIFKAAEEDSRIRIRNTVVRIKSLRISNTIVK